MTKKETANSFCPKDQKEWRAWLSSNHIKEDSVWLIIYKQGSASPNITWSEAVDEALCFGWIDSTKKPIDEEKYMQYFGKRKAKSTWSKINKDKIEVLQKNGLMKPAGLKCIEVAKENGSWTILDSVEQLIIPEDLEEAFKQHPNSKAFFIGLSKSIKKGMLYWVISAKRPETRAKRIQEIVEKTSQGEKPKGF